jgi:signal transduction histidine kinase
LEPHKHAAVGSLDVAAAVHELKNPIETLVNLVYLLQQNPTLDGQGREYVRLAEKELQRLHSMISEMLAGYRKVAEPKLASVSQVLETVLRFNEQKFAFKQIKVATRYDSDGLIKAHPEDLRQIFANLVVNAAEALPPKGKLTIRVRQCGQEDGNGTGVRVLIADNGSGISPEQRVRVFQQSFTTKGERGTGLGLWMTAQTISTLGGSIRFKSSTRQGRSGTVFSIFLPLQAGYWRGAHNRIRPPSENRVMSRKLLADHHRLVSHIRVQCERYSAFKIKAD